MNSQGVVFFIYLLFSTFTLHIQMYNTLQIYIAGQCQSLPISITKHCHSVHSNTLFACVTIIVSLNIGICAIIAIMHHFMNSEGNIKENLRRLIIHWLLLHDIIIVILDAVHLKLSRTVRTVYILSYFPYTNIILISSHFFTILSLIAGVW
jgi:hypothetical protein